VVPAATVLQNKPIAINRAKVTSVQIRLRDDNRFRRYTHKLPDATLTEVAIKIFASPFSHQRQGPLLTQILLANHLSQISMPLRRRGCSPEGSSRSYLLKDLCRKNRTLTVSVQLRRAAISRFFPFQLAQMTRQQYPDPKRTVPRLHRLYINRI
jgi:hypothetical protein